MIFCWKQDKWNVWPPLMIISWQSLVLYSDFLNKKRFVIWNGIILPLQDTRTFYHSIKNYLAPLFDLRSNKQKITKWSSKCKLLFVYSTNAANTHSCGSKDLTKLVPVVAWYWDNVKTKEISQTLIRPSQREASTTGLFVCLM